MQTSVVWKRGWVIAFGITFALTTGLTSAQETKTTPPAGASPQPVAAATAQPATAPPQQAVYGFERLTDQMDKFIHKTKQPTQWWKWGADLRLRNEYFDNALTLNNNLPNHEHNYQRYRARWYNTINPVKDLEFNLRLTWEGWHFNKSAWRGNALGQTGWVGWDATEGIFDNLNIKWTNIFNQPLQLTLGRQDILLGDGWLVLDGTPLDGSRTIYFDAARLTYNLADYKTTIDVMYIDQDSMNDRWLPPINHLEKQQVEHDERGAILYVSNKSLAKTQVDGYFIHKHTDRQLFRGAYRGDNANIHTAGGRVAGDITANLSYRVEGAYQFGDKFDVALNPNNEVNLSAFGINDRLAYSFKDRLNNQVRIQHEFLTGDDPNTGTDEQFDLVWGRWPRWHELYVFSYARESRIAQTANIHRIGPGWTFNPIKKLEFSADYYFLFADEEVPSRAGDKGAAVSNAFSRTGNERGHYLATILRYRHNQHLSGHLWGEFLWPGDFYQQHELIPFLRAEIMLTW